VRRSCFASKDEIAALVVAGRLAGIALDLEAVDSGVFAAVAAARVDLPGIVLESEIVARSSL
jgi:hypothetical protein